MTELVAIQSELLSELRAVTGRTVWPSDTLGDLGLTRDGAAHETSVGELIAAQLAASGPCRSNP